jgi:Uma2 family endonuclease
MSGLLHVSPKVGFTRRDLADLPDVFPPCVIRGGKIARADGLPLEWEQYDQLGKGFPATLTEDGELQMSPRPTPAHEKKAKNLVKLLDHYLSCQPGGETHLGPELRIRPYRRTLVPDVMYFRDPKPEWDKSATYIDQIPDLAVEIVSPSNLGKKLETNLAFYHNLAFPEVWLVQLDGTVEIRRAAEPKMNAACKPGELFDSPLFPGLAMDPAWLTNYPNEIKRIDQFSPGIMVSPSVVNPDLTQKAYDLAGRIAEHFGKTDPPARLQSEISREAGRRSGISPEPRARRERNPGREQER